MITLVSKKTSKLTKTEINSIIKLKNSFWKYGIQANKDWFKEYVKKNDIHNFLIINNILIGYTLLRKRKIISKSYNNYFYFDTLIIKKNYRKNNYSNLLMTFNNEIIKKNKMLAFLICSNDLIKFYFSFKWKKINKNIFKIADHKIQSNGMIFNNFKNTKLSNLIFYFNK